MQIIYINSDGTVTQHDRDEKLKIDTSGLLKNGNFSYDTGNKLTEEKRGLIIFNDMKELSSYHVHATLGADSSMKQINYDKSDYQSIILENFHIVMVALAFMVFMVAVTIHIKT